MLKGSCGKKREQGLALGPYLSRGLFLFYNLLQFDCVHSSSRDWFLILIPYSPSIVLGLLLFCVSNPFNKSKMQWMEPESVFSRGISVFSVLTLPQCCPSCSPSSFSGCQSYFPGRQRAKVHQKGPLDPD